MAPRTGKRILRLSRNAITLLFLGLLGTVAAYRIGIPRITDVVPLLPDWLMNFLGWTNLGLGLLLLISGIISQQVRELVARLEDLMVCGPFRYCRRPVYGGLLMIIIGAAFLMNETSLLITAALWSFVASVYSQFEDKSLRLRLGYDYKNYRRSTPLLLPHIGRLIADFFRVE